MPNSLKCKIKHLCHNGTITERERDRLLRALEQEPCEDCVSRQAVLDINESHHGQMPNHINHQIWQEIKDLPPVTPQEPKTGWILVSERLPIIETDVLLTSWNGKQQFVGWIDVYGKWQTEYGEVVEGYEPIAWMPLPEPYKESKE